MHSSPLRLLGFWLCLLVLIGSCSADSRSSGGAGGSVAVSAGEQPEGQAAIPASLKMALLRVQQKAEGYDFASDATGTLHGKAGGFGAAAEVAATPRGVRISSRASGGFGLGVETTSVGRAGAPASRGVRGQHAEGQELVLDREDGVEERFLAGPLGLEHSYVVTSRPEGRGPLAIEVAFEGLRPELVEGATDRVLLRDDAGLVRAGYRDLVAVDAGGRDLAVRMEVRGAGVGLVIDDARAAYPLRVDPIVWTQQAELTASDGAANDQLGSSVAVSGGTAVVGARGRNNGQGAAYVFVQTGTTWTQQAELTASDGAVNDEFGQSVAVSGGTIVVGANAHKVSGNSNQGAAYVFVQSGTTWTQQAELTADDGVAGDSFGAAVSVNGGTAVVGAVGHNVGGHVGQGAAYVFVQSGTTWTEQAELTADDGAANDAFGFSVAVSGGTVVIGAYQRPFLSSPRFQGAAYVFVQSGTDWTQQAELTASDGAAEDLFGSSVAVTGGTAVIGAPGHNGGQGAAYVFVQSGTDWTQQAELTASDGAANESFGFSVALSGGTVVIGAYSTFVQVDHPAYVFVESGTSWTQQAELTASDGGGNDRFGWSVAVSGGAALVGALNHKVGANNNQGAAYVFEFCTISGAAYAAGTVNPANACQVCTPATSTTTWTNEPLGTSCGTGAVCGVSGACGCNTNPSSCAAPYIAAGRQHTVALRSDGTVWTWGDNTYGELGNGTTTSSDAPVQVSQASGLTQAIAVAAGLHTVALRSDGTVWTWGYNAHGQLGNGTTTNASTPVQVVGPGGVGTLTGIIAVAAGLEHTVALRSDGTVWDWGYNLQGSLGNGTLTSSSTPVQASGLTGVASVAAGANFTLAVKLDGTLWAWGFNFDGELGNGTNSNSSTPVQGLLTGVVAAAGGDYHSLALKADGTVWAWGYGSDGELGNGGSNSLSPVQVSQATGLTSAIAVAASAYSSLALKSDGTVWAWGDNSVGELGNGTITQATTPVQVSEASGLTTATAIAADNGNAMAVKPDGTVWTWGDNQWGQIGNGTTINQETPFQVSGLGLAVCANLPVCSSTSGACFTTALANGGACGSGGGGVCASGSCACVIGGTSYPDDGVNPSNGCQVCIAELSSNGWTSEPDGLSCAAGMVCSMGACTAACFIGGTVYASGTANPAIACQECTPSTSTSAWSIAPDGTACGAGVCASGSCECVIGGVPYPAGAVNPANPCQECTPASSVSAWSNEPNGTACGAGQVCFSGGCAPGCSIGGVAYAAGTVDPGNACQVCTPSSSTTAWSNEPTGLFCQTGRICDGASCASVCFIGGTIYASRGLNPANHCQWCIPATSNSAWSNEANGTSCTGGKCENGTCAGSCSGTCSGGAACTGNLCGCLISGQAYAPGTVNPANPCQACISSLSTTAWSTAYNETACGGGGVCVSGACGCVIAGSDYAPGSNPANACEVCAPATSTSAWITEPNGTSCNQGSGDALSFSGAIGSYVSVPSNAGIPAGAAPRTVELWVYTTAATWAQPNPAAFEYGTSTTREAFGIGLHASPTQFSFYTWGNDILVNTSVQTGWIHLAMTYDGTTLSAYVNGVLVGQLAGPLNTRATAISIGESPLNGINWNGYIDEVRIWSVARTASQIHGAMSEVIAADTPGLVSYYRFESGSGTIAVDTGPLGNNGTLSGSPLPTWLVPPSPEAFGVCAGAGCASDEVCASGACVNDCFIGGALFSAGTLNPADACQVCTPATSTTAWTSQPDGLSCGSGRVCGSGACASDCFIAGLLYPAGATNGGNPCQVCAPATSTTAWSNAPATTLCLAPTGPCDLGAFCTGSSPVCPPDAYQPNTTACLSPTGPCDVGAFCTGSSAACPADAYLPAMTQCLAPSGPCDLGAYCTGSSATCPADTLQSDGASCPGGVCASGICASDCFIGGVLYPAGAQNSPDTCQVCAPATSTSAWTNLPDGTACLGGVCASGSCATDCFIGTMLYPSGTVNPANACQVCTPATSTTTWSNQTDGTTCSDGNLCTSNDVCTAGACGGTPYACAPTSCQQSSTCDGNGGCTIVDQPGGTLCPSDGNPCHGDVCDAVGNCTYPNLSDGTSCGSGEVCQAGSCGAECFIGGVIVASGTLNMANPCQQCTPGSSTTTWSDVSSGVACPDDGNPCTTDLCDGSGTCAHAALADGTSCGSGELCQSGSCGAQCEIGGTFYGSGTINPAQPCQVCTPGTSTTAWTNLADGMTCSDGSACTQTDTCQSGVCTGMNPVVCTASDPCHAVGVCNPSTGTCSNPNAADGTPCNDGNACTQTDTCQAGACTGMNPVVCAGSDQCHVAGFCNPSTGMCSNPSAPNGTSCNDGNACTSNDVCTGGSCGGTPFTCTPTACQASSTCNGTSCTIVNAGSGVACPSDGNPCHTAACDGGGTCAHQPLPDGASCGAGQVCSSGICTSDCFIGGTLYALGTVNPQNPCEVCNPAASTGAWSPGNDGATCDDGNACTANDACSAGTCAGTAFTCTPTDCQASSTCNGTSCTIVDQPSGTACTSNGNPCDANTCDGSGTCTHPSLPDGTSCGAGLICGGGSCVGECFIGGVLVPFGTVNPANACQVCTPATSTTAWSNVMDGTTCDDGDLCTSSDACSGGTCVGTGFTCTPTDCQVSSTCNGTSCTIVNAGSGVTCTSDGNPCHADTCDGAGTCTHGDLPDGTSCGSGELCQSGSCGAECEIGGMFYGAGTINPANACEVCAPMTLTTDWSPVADGTTCNDGNPCSANDACNAGTCTGTIYACTPTSCEASSTCNGMGGCTIVNAAGGTSCPSDGNPCHGDVCDGAGSCAHANLPDGTVCGGGVECMGGSCGAGCTILGVNYPPGTINTANACQACVPGTSTSQWTNRPNNTACDDGNLCTSNDVCTAGACAGTAFTCVATSCQQSSTCNGTSCTITEKGSGVACPSDGNPCHGDACDGAGTCAHPNLPDGTSCGTGEVCSAGSCLADCFIGGTVFAGGAKNPANACQVCAPAISTTAWSLAANGTSCNDGDACTSNDACNAGTCGGTRHTCTPTSCQASSTCDGNGGCTIVNKVSGVSCPSDGNPCHGDACDGAGTCAHPAKADGTACGSGGQVCASGGCGAGCFIGGKLVGSGTINPANACQACEPAISTTAWSSATNGTACNDGNACTSSDVCTAGACGGASYTCTPGVCQVASACDGKGGCTVTNAGVGVACPSDGNPCHADACDGAGTCAHANLSDGTACGAGMVCQAGTCGAQCFIGGSIEAAGAANPMNACEVCTPATSTTAWSSASDGTACGNGTGCNAGQACKAGTCTSGTQVTCKPMDACHAAGTCDATTGDCSNPALPDGTACPLGACEAGVCTPSADAGADGGNDAGTGGAASSSSSGSAAGGATGTGGATTSGSTSSSGSTASGSTASSGAAGANTGSSSSSSGVTGFIASGGGCGCHVQGESPDRGAWLLGAVPLLLLRRRRSTARSGDRASRP